MYLNILFIPFFSVLISFFLSNFLGRRGILLLILTMMFLTFLLVWLGFYDIILSNSIIFYSLFS